MPSSRLYAGLQDPCCTTLNLGAVCYFMVAYAAGVETRNSEIGGIRVHAQIYTMGEQGQRSLLYDGVVFTAAANHVVECVRCVHASDNLLIVYFIDRDTAAGTSTLKARFENVTTFDSSISWQTMDDIALDDGGLYDVKQVDDPPGASEFMLAWISAVGAPGTVIVRRVNSDDHTGAVWSSSLSVNVTDRVIAVTADGSAGALDGGVVVAYQNTANDLIAHVLDFVAGADQGALSAVTSTTAEFCAVGLCKTASTAGVYIVAELFETLSPVLDTEDNYAHLLAYAHVRANGSPAIYNSAARAYNLNMMSKPYSYTDAEGTAHVYCGLAYSSVWNDDPYREQNAFICDMGIQHGTGGIRPRPVSTYSNQNVDCRNHGYSPEVSARFDAGNGFGKRMNHLSNFAVGPSWLNEFRKSRAVVWPMWGGVRTIAIDPGGNDSTPRTEPVFAAAKAIWHILEDPWTADRDSTDPGQPSENFHGANPGSLYDNAEVQDELLIAGGTPHLYDGQRLTELGFPWTPEIIDVTDNPAAAGSIPAGDYRYTAVYEWRDSRGHLHRSGHGNIIEYTAPGTDSAVLTIRTLTLSNRDAAWLYPTSSPIVIAVYRTTLAQPNIFRRLFSTSAAGFTIADIPVNDPSAWAVNVTDDLTNAQLKAAPPLNYINGGNAEQYTELPPSLPPASHLVANWQNRAWLIASENKELWYSKENLPTAATGRLAPEFHPALRFLLDEVDGEVTGLHPMDDELVIFTRDGIYSLSGSGPDTLGNGAAYRLQLVYKNIGCIEPRSICEVPQGVVFQSYTGIHLLDRGRAVSFDQIGAPPEDLIREAGNVRAAVYLPDRHQVAFVVNGAVADEPLVAKWDFLMKQWSTARLEPPNTNTWLSSTAGGCAWRANERDASLVVLCQGNLLVERGKDDATPYRDENDVGGTSLVRIDVETGWVHFAGIAGHIRTWEIGITISNQVAGSAVYTELDVDRDGSYDTSSPEDHRFGGIYHGDLESYLPIKPATQRMTSFRLRVYEPSASTEGALTLNGFSATIGVQKRLRRVSATTRGQPP